MVVEQGRGSKPIKRVPLCSLLQFLLLGSCLGFLDPMSPSLKTLIRYPVLRVALTFKRISFDLSEPTLVIVVLPQNWLSTGIQRSLVNEAE